MPANPWELRADVRPLDVAAARWTEIGALMSRRGDEIVEAARRATEGWDAAAAESYEQHRRQVLVNLDRFTTLATQIAGSLRAVSAILTSSQEELDHAWIKVALVPHEVVGESRYLVFEPQDDEGRGKVSEGRAETEEIRRRLALSLDEESARLRQARAELVTVRTALTTLTGGTFGRLTGPGTGPGFGPGGEESGVGTVLPSTSVLGSAQSGVTAGPAGLTPGAPIAVPVPHLTGLSAAALAPFAATAAAGLAGRSGGRRTTATPVTPPMGGMAAGAVGARAGTTSRGMANGRADLQRLGPPRIEDEDEAAAAARARRDEKEAKRAALEEKRAERAARRAQREKDREEDRPAIVVVEVAPGEAPPEAAGGTDGPTYGETDSAPDAEGAERVRRP